MMNRMMRRIVPAALLLLPLPATAMAADYFLYSGTYTDGSSKGIYAWRFNDADGRMAPLGLVAQTPQPAHIWITPNGKYLYTVNWLQDGAVSAYAIDRHTGALRFLNKVSAHGADPNQVVVDPSGRVAVTVNYISGTIAAYRILPDGRLSEAFYTEKHQGKPLSDKQPGPKQHGVEFSRDGKFMYVADLGLDRVYTYHFDAAEPSITHADPPYIETHAGAGPRRLQLSPNGKFLYVCHETDSEVQVFSVQDGRLKSLQTLSTIPAGFTGRNSTAEILVSADGRFVYVTNRGDDSIAIFAADPATGRLTRSANVPSGGKTPRNIRFSPKGDYLLAANQGGNNITEFRVDKKTGGLTPTGVILAIDQPGGMYFTKAQ
jgi:6-phosphogluconolactonase